MLFETLWTVHPTPLAIVLLGLALMLAELLLPTVGILGTLGLGSVVVGTVMLIKHITPVYSVGLPVLLSLIIINALFAITAIVLAIRSRFRPKKSGPQTFIGQTVTVEQSPDHRWYCKINGERWNITATGPLNAGDTVQITAVDGLLLHVECHAA